MKNMKKLIALALVAMTILAVAAPALASVTGYIPYLGGNGSSYNIRRGHRGPQVTNLQIMLNAAGYNCGNPDGIFGGNTETAVKAFQRAKSLRVDGIVGGATKTKLWGTLNYQAPNGCVVIY